MKLAHLYVPDSYNYMCIIVVTKVRALHCNIYNNTINDKKKKYTLLNNFFFQINRIWMCKTHNYSWLFKLFKNVRKFNYSNFIV